MEVIEADIGTLTLSPSQQQHLLYNRLTDYCLI